MDAIWNGIDQATPDRGYDAQVVAQVVAPAGRNHFGVVWAPGDPGEPLCRAAAAWMLHAI